MILTMKMLYYRQVIYNNYKKMIDDSQVKKRALFAIDVVL